MKKIVLGTTIAYILSLPGIVVPVPAAFGQQGITSAELGLRVSMQNLWENYLLLLRSYAAASVRGSSDVYALTDRLLDNEERIAAEVRPYYGVRAARKLGILLKDHVLLAIEYIDAIAADGATFDIERRWAANTDAIADFLLYRNGTWTRRELYDLFGEHLRLLKADIGYRSKGVGKGSDRLNLQTENLALALAAGIARRFAAPAVK